MNRFRNQPVESCSVEGRISGTVKPVVQLGYPAGGYPRMWVGWLDLRRDTRVLAILARDIPPSAIVPREFHRHLFVPHLLEILRRDPSPRSTLPRPNNPRRRFLRPSESLQAFLREPRKSHTRTVCQGIISRMFRLKYRGIFSAVNLLGFE